MLRNFKYIALLVVIITLFKNSLFAKNTKSNCSLIKETLDKLVNEHIYKNQEENTNKITLKNKMYNHVQDIIYAIYGRGNVRSDFINR